MAWKKAHKSSGATVIEHRVKGCRLKVTPADWTKPKGEAVWSATCGSGKSFDHKRGNARTVAAAKKAATRAAKRLRR